MQTLPLSRNSGVRLGAFDLAAALDAYELATARLVETWLDTDLYSDLRTQIEAIRDHGMGSPLLTVVVLQLVIAHHELLSTMWQDATMGVAPEKMQLVRDRHALAITELRLVAAGMLRND